MFSELWKQAFSRLLTLRLLFHPLRTLRLLQSQSSGYAAIRDTCAQRVSHLISSFPLPLATLSPYALLYTIRHYHSIFFTAGRPAELYRRSLF